MQALNSLNFCKATLMAREPMYLSAQQLLAEAQQAIATLQSIDLGREGAECQSSTTLPARQCWRSLAQKPPMPMRCPP